MKTVFIINPAAGKQDSSRQLREQIWETTAKLNPGGDVLIELTRYPGHARELAEQYAKTGEPVRLYACGGDGTLHEVLQGMANYPNAMLGDIPCGSGNDFIHNFCDADIARNIAAQLNATPTSLDVIKTEEEYTATICAAGLDAQVAYQIPQFRRIPGCGGNMAYTLSIVKALFSSFRHQLRLNFDGTTVEGEYMLLAICNGKYYGGGYCAAPNAAMNDGILDVILVRPVPRAKLPGLLAQYKNGRHLTPENSITGALQPYMQFFRARRVELDVLDGSPLIVSCDGECSPRLHLCAEVLPQKVTFLRPQPPAFQAAQSE